MAFIVYGSQQLLVKKQTKKLIEDKTKNSGDVESIYFDSTKITEDELLDECEQYSLYNNLKVIVVENCNFLTGERVEGKFSYSNKLIDYLKNENKNTILIFNVVNEKKLDSKSRIYNSINEKNIIFCKDLTESEWPKQVSLFFKKKNVLIEDSAIEEICKRSNGDFNTFINESKKLLLYKQDHIYLEDVKNIFTKPLNNDIFELQNALLRNNKIRAIEIFRDLQTAKNADPVVLIAIFANQLILLDKILYLYDKNLSFGAIASEIGANPYFVRMNIMSFKNIKRETLSRAIDKLFELDRDIKHSQIDKYFGFELFIANF